MAAGANLHELEQLGRRAMEGLHAAARSVRFEELVGARLEGAQAGLSGAVSPLAATEGDVRETLRGFCEALSERYTMQREREAHFAAAAAIGLDLEPQDETVTLDTVDDLLF